MNKLKSAFASLTANESVERADAVLAQPSSEDVAALRNKYEEAQQGHVFNFWDSLSQHEQSTLFSDLSQIDPVNINKIVQKSKQVSAEATENKLEPLPAQVRDSVIDASEEQRLAWYNKGLELIGYGDVAVVVMAGGQGTRLGSSDPKGCYNIGLPSQKSLFQLQAERIIKIQKLALKYRQANQGKDEQVKEVKVIVPWYVMTSGPTRSATEKFFQKNDFFGLDSKHVVFFDQGTLPCISNDDKILLSSRFEVAKAPDGNGGIYSALLKGGILEDMQKRGIAHVHVYCVDNCLAKVVDPTLIGFSTSRDLDIVTKVVRKRSAEEPVGLVMLRNGKPDVVEYSEISPEIASQTESSHKGDQDESLLKFRAANIVQHYYSLRFLSKALEWNDKLPHHVAKKKIPFYDMELEQVVKPDSPNGIKMEQFVFDVFPMIPLAKFGCLEVNRNDEFSPLKNATGEDSPASSREDLLRQGMKWVKEAGGVATSDGSENGADQGVEVSPLVSYAGEGLEIYVRGKEIRGRSLIEIPK